MKLSINEFQDGEFYNEEHELPNKMSIKEAVTWWMVKVQEEDQEVLDTFEYCLGTGNWRGGEYFYDGADVIRFNGGDGSMKFEVS